MRLRMHTEAPAPLLLLIGLAFLAGAAALAWFSAPVSLLLTRVDATTVRADFQNRLFGLVPVSELRVESIRSVEVVDGRAPGSTSRDTGNRQLVFQTASGLVNEGYAQQRFRAQYTDLRDFIADPAQTELRLSSAYDFREMLRFVAAQAAVVFLAAMGALLLVLFKSKLFPDPYEGVGPR